MSQAPCLLIIRFMGNLMEHVGRRLEIVLRFNRFASILH